jgi:hypothetical protein
VVEYLASSSAFSLLSQPSSSLRLSCQACLLIRSIDARDIIYSTGSDVWSSATPAISASTNLSSVKLRSAHDALGFFRWNEMDIMEAVYQKNTFRRGPIVPPQPHHSYIFIRLGHLNPKTSLVVAPGQTSRHRGHVILRHIFPSKT